MHFAKVFGCIGVAVMVIIASANGAPAIDTTSPSGWEIVESMKRESKFGTDPTTVKPDREETTSEKPKDSKFIFDALIKLVMPTFN